jgi:predicted lipid-binding transport protein (Tim44 family)
MVQRETDPPTPGPLAFRYVTTAKAAVDAASLARPRLSALDRWVDVAGLVSGLLFAAIGGALGSPAIGAIGAVLIFAGLFALLTARTRPVQRWFVAKRFGSLLGHTVDASLDEAGIHLNSVVSTSFLPWSSFSAVRANAETVAFFRGSVPIAYIPASAFSSPAEQANVVTFASARIVAAAKVAPHHPGRIDPLR